MGKIELGQRLSDVRARMQTELPVEERGLAKFARLVRKDARLRADQDAALSTLTKTVMRRRRVKTERITENTLIRVAIDLLLAHADTLRGSTEDELRRSVITALPNSRTPAVPDSGSAHVRDSQTSAVTDHGASRQPRSATSERPAFDSSLGQHDHDSRAHETWMPVTSGQPGTVAR
ncbi:MULTISPECIES: hypothetical protein [Microbacterium]|uniref:hypothetical protein n=1 Tax=Microbacterium TaxID=33882 RepID=UPI0004B737F7|nr:MULTISPECIES: hypothetical protein [Microbacterium]